MQNQQHGHQPPPPPVAPPLPESIEPIEFEMEPIEVQDENEPLSLIGDGEMTGDPKLRAFGSGADRPDAHQQKFRRLAQPDKGAVRCRIFCSKVAHTSLEHLERQINEWLDEDDDIEIKHVGHVVGQMTGKTTEPNFIVMCWY